MYARPLCVQVCVCVWKVWQIKVSCKYLFRKKIAHFIIDAHDADAYADAVASSVNSGSPSTRISIGASDTR